MAETLRREEGFVVGSDSAVTLTGDHTHFHCTRRQLHFALLSFWVFTELHFFPFVLCENGRETYKSSILFNHIF